MLYLKAFFVDNFILLAIAILMTINCIQKYRESKKNSIFILAILGTAIFLAMLDTFKDFARNDLKNAYLTTFVTCISYVLRPTCILLFIFLFGPKTKSKLHYLLFIPIVLNILIYILPLIKQTDWMVFVYTKENDKVFFCPGTTPLRYTSHFISFIYLCYIVYLAISQLKVKHLSHAAIIFACVAIILIVATIETLEPTGEIRLLNGSIAICTAFYYIYLYSERAKYDPLTGLFNRAMYYSDLPKFENSITGVIQIDMNGLKYINDTFGHIEGDLSLEICASIFLRVSTRKMYVYRLGGDEFLILAINEEESKIIYTISKIRTELAKTKYSCALGYSYRSDKDIPFETLLKDAERKMYEDKDSFYKAASFQRRKTISY